MNDPARYARYIADEPRWVDTRGMLLCWPVTVLEGEAGADPAAGGGFVVVSELEPVGAVVGRPGDETVAQAAALLAARRREHPAELLTQPEDAEAVARALPGWTLDPATLHTLGGHADTSALHSPGGPAGPPALRPDAEVVLVPPFERHRLPPAAVPAPVWREIEPTWGRGRPVTVAFVEGRPASFCLGTLETETLWDVSIETLEPYRHGGLAAACFAALRDHYLTLGKQAVWGAHDSNPASLRLAARLGFLPAARLEVFVQPD